MRCFGIIIRATNSFSWLKQLREKLLFLGDRCEGECSSKFEHLISVEWLARQEENFRLSWPDRQIILVVNLLTTMTFELQRS